MFIDHLQAEAEATPGVVLANLFVDEPYHRTGFTFVSDQPDRLTAAVIRLSRAALQLLDLRRHEASHPRLGVVDHISLHPLGSLLASTHAHGGLGATPQRHSPPASPQHGQDQHHLGRDHHHHNHHQQQHAPQQHATVWEPPPPGLRGLAVAASCAQDIAWTLSGVGDSGEYDADGISEPNKQLNNEQQQQQQGAGEEQPPGNGVPVYLYGFAHPSRRSLSEVRRQLGYFKSSPDGSWHGDLSHQVNLAEDLRRFPPDLGPQEVPARSGLLTVGAVPWVVNFNIPLSSVDLNTARWFAKALSERGGGLPCVEAMALNHSSGKVEVACNLLDIATTPPSQVQARLEALAYSRGLQGDEAVGEGYRTNKSPEELLRAAVETMGALKG